ncbi:hypothetical protein LDL08_01550 [Nonomuraea glycinis]|uniref:Uncharacterized protein n=1 Tax=Nonomuraea glycinis TaxID=2047744 RepID=A0A917ZZF1_9ACTN|nr:hypothetical protein [Nonomuraea glycinis]MCA2174861.1 hypothetical protein [Nonomuraea glycinis]GGP01511.1 hypothetical protein GCM10012278_05040 [Nonomuraea glycinis]
MVRKFAGALLLATALTVTLAPLPASAATGAPATAPPAAMTVAGPAGAAPAVMAVTGSAESAPKLIAYKIYFGRCKDTCRIKVRVTNKSRKTLYSVNLNARLKINGRKAGSCYDYIGKIRPKRVRWGGCTVRTRTLSTLWNRWLDGEIRYDKDVNTVVHYEYYR